MKTSDEFVKVSGILYRFRVTAVTAEGGVSFPSDPSEPFVIDIPGVQVQPSSFAYLKNELLFIIVYPRLSNKLYIY